VKRVNDEKLAAFVAACRQAGDYGLVRYSSGNMSWRIDQHLFAITARGAWLGRLCADDIALCTLQDGSCINGKKPSVESGFHRGLFQVRPEIDVVFHCQSPYATAICCNAPEKYNFSVLPELPFSVGAPAIIPYLAPGSQELAAALTGAMKDHDLALLRNHGQVVVGKGFQSVFEKAGFFELACEILLHANNVSALTEKDITALRARAVAERAAKGKQTV